MALKRDTGWRWAKRGTFVIGSTIKMYINNCTRKSRHKREHIQLHCSEFQEPVSLTDGNAGPSGGRPLERKRYSSLERARETFWIAGPNRYFGVNGSYTHTHTVTHICKNVLLEMTAISHLIVCILHLNFKKKRNSMLL